jgi:hypothetical protein
MEHMASGRRGTGRAKHRAIQQGQRTIREATAEWSGPSVLSTTDPCKDIKAKGPGESRAVQTRHRRKFKEMRQRALQPLRLNHPPNFGFSLSRTTRPKPQRTAGVRAPVLRLGLPN